MATVLSPQSRRPALLRAGSCPSPRPPPLQYFAQSTCTTKWPAYLESGSWQDARAYNAPETDLANPFAQCYASVEGAASTMDATLGNSNIYLPLGGGSFQANLGAVWGDMFSAGDETTWLGAADNSFDLEFSLPSDFTSPQPLSHAIGATVVPSFITPSAATVLSDQAVPFRDAEPKTTAPQFNHSESVSPSPDLQDYLTQQTPPMTVPLPRRRSIKSDSKSSSQRKSGAAQKNRNWGISTTNEVKDGAGKVVGFEHVLAPDIQVRVKRTQTKEQKQRRAINYQHGACLYHKGQHRACDPRCLPYLRCATSNLPTFYYSIDNIRLFRERPAAGHPLESKRPELFRLQEIEGVMQHGVPVRLTQDLGHELVVYVAWYIPRPDDKLNHVWHYNGERREIHLPPYCLTRLDEVRANVSQYVTAATNQYLEDVIQRSGPITQAMLVRAVQFSVGSKSTLVSSVLRLLAITRMIERDWHITEPNTLGIPCVYEAGCPWFGKVPVTPMMDTGLDQIVIQDILEPLRQGILSGLQGHIQGKRRQDCFEIVLAVFAIATNTEWLLRHSKGNALRYNTLHRYSSIALASEYFHGHNVLLSHFHYFAYGADTSRGKRKAGSAIVPYGSSLSREQSGFLAHIQRLVESQVPYARQLRAGKLYEVELHWSHEIFLRDWQPGTVEVVDDVLA